MTPTQGDPFRLVHSGVLRQRVRDIMGKALEREIDAEVRNEILALQDRMSHDPEDCGDEIGQIPTLGLYLRHKLLRMLCVRFAVDPVRRIVYVQDYVATRDYAFLDPS